MALSINSQIEIFISKDIKTVSGKTLPSNTTSCFTTEMTPMYCSVEDVRRFAGGYIEEVNDDIISQLIVRYSVAADTMSSCFLSIPPSSADYRLFLQVRSYWVLLKTTLNIIFNTNSYIITGQGKQFKQLGDFSVSKGEVARTSFETGVHKFIKWLECEIYKYEYALVNCTTPLSNCLGLTDVSASSKDYTPLPPSLINRGAFDSDKPLIGRRWLVSPTDLPDGSNSTIVGSRKFATNDPAGFRNNRNQTRNPYGRKGD